jgi:hypothetical protein
LSLWSVICRQSSVLKGVLMTNKALFCSFYVSFCTICASLRLTRSVFRQPKTSIISVNPVILSNFSPCSSWLYLLILAYLSSRSVKFCVNSWLIKGLRSTKVYVRKNKLFLQNEPKFRKVKYDVNRVLTRGYDQLDTWPIRTTKPIKANKSQ